MTFFKSLIVPLLSVVLAACVSSSVVNAAAASYKATIMCENGGILTLENTTDFITTCYHYVDGTGYCGYGPPYTSYYHPKWSHFEYGVMWNSWCNDKGYASLCYWDDETKHWLQVNDTACPTGDEVVTTIVKDGRNDEDDRRRALRGFGPMMQTVVQFQEVETVIDGLKAIVLAKKED